jgi:hypothetical protein
MKYLSSVPPETLGIAQTTRMPTCMACLSQTTSFPFSNSCSGFFARDTRCTRAASPHIKRLCCMCLICSFGSVRGAVPYWCHATITGLYQPNAGGVPNIQMAKLRDPPQEHMEWLCCRKHSDLSGDVCRSERVPRPDLLGSLASNAALDLHGAQCNHQYNQQSSMVFQDARIRHTKTCGKNKNAVTHR